MRNTIRKVTIVVAVLITNCHVLENWKIGPVTSHAPTTTIAIVNAHALPLHFALARANCPNAFVSFNGLCLPFREPLLINQRGEPTNWLTAPFNLPQQPPSQMGNFPTNAALPRGYATIISASSLQGPYPTAPTAATRKKYFSSRVKFSTDTFVLVDPPPSLHAPGSDAFRTSAT